MDSAGGWGKPLKKPKETTTAPQKTVNTTTNTPPPQTQVQAQVQAQAPVQANPNRKIFNFFFRA